MGYQTSALAFIFTFALTIKKFCQKIISNERSKLLKETQAQLSLKEDAKKHQIIEDYQNKHLNVKLFCLTRFFSNLLFL